MVKCAYRPGNRFLVMESHQNLSEREIGSISAIPSSLEEMECLRTGLIWLNASVLLLIKVRAQPVHSLNHSSCQLGTFSAGLR